MNRETDQSFAMKIEKTPQGSFKVTAKSFPDVPAVERPTIKQASMVMNQQIQELNRAGKLKGSS